MNLGGRPKNIETPEELWEYFLAYTKHVKENPMIVTDWVGGMGKEVERKKERPLTIDGFCNYVEDLGVTGNVDYYLSNYKGMYSEFLGICSRIKRTIREDQITGGMCGVYNPSITQRLNGLAEKQEQTGAVKITVTSKK